MYVKRVALSAQKILEYLSTFVRHLACSENPHNPVSSQPVYNEHSKQLLASERKKYIIILFTDKTGLRGTARHWQRRTQDTKGPISLALVSWRWGGGYGGGRDGDWEWKGGGWRIFYHGPVLTSITLAFFKSMCSAHSPCGLKRPTISKCWSFKWKKNI